MARRRDGESEERSHPDAAIGNLEEAHDQVGSPSMQLLESPVGPLNRHWRRLSRRTRYAILAATALAAALVAFLTRPQPPVPIPTGFPAQSTVVTYRGAAAAPLDPSGRSVAFQLAAADTDLAPVTIVQVSSPYRGVTLRTEPALPLTVPPGRTVSIHLIMLAFDCSSIPRNDELPFLDVTFRNTRAMEQESEILGDRFTSDLHRAMTMACRRT